MVTLAELPEVTVSTFRAAILWAWHGRHVRLVYRDAETAKRARRLLADRLGDQRAEELVRVELQQTEVTQ